MKDKNYKVRSHWDLLEFNDDEMYDLKAMPSMTDPSQDETIEDLVARLMRGEVMRSDALYDYTDPVDPQEAIDALPAVNSDGFDIADIGQIIATGEAVKASLDKPAEKQVVVEQPKVDPVVPN